MFTLNDTDIPIILAALRYQLERDDFKKTEEDIDRAYGIEELISALEEYLAEDLEEYLAEDDE